MVFFYNPSPRIICTLLKYHIKFVLPFLKLFATRWGLPLVPGPHTLGKKMLFSGPFFWKVFLGDFKLLFDINVFKGIFANTFFTNRGPRYSFLLPHPALIYRIAC